MVTLIIAAGSVSLLLLFVFLAFIFRRVVPTNEVHIVQSSKKTLSYGKDHTDNGNTYYQWPSWVPYLGVSKTILPVSVFDIDLIGYEAYDIDRLPFMVDVKAFFRITESNVAAQRVSSFEELQSQLSAVVQGAVRTILASNDLEAIMQGRSKFGDQFTKEVDSQLSNWGVATVKTIELMDIRDSRESNVIRNVMEKKKSYIDMESRTEVAKNKKAAEIAEIEAKKEINLNDQNAKKEVGLRTISVDREILISGQEKEQAIKEQEKITKEKEMLVQQVERVRAAEITKQVMVVEAEQQKQTIVIVAEGQLESKKKESEGITVEGKAKAEAEKAMQLAPVEAQIVLAKEIGDNDGYQKYLVTIEQVKATQAVGIAQASALEKADIKIINNSGTPTEGMNNLMDIFTSKGGTGIGAMLEGLAQSEVGGKVIEKVTGKSKSKN